MNAEKIVNLPGRMTQGIELGTVRGGSEAGYVVHGPSGIIVATVAFSCLVKPMAGDKVMYTRDPQEGCYILAILERPTSPDAVLSFPGDVVVEAAKGHMTISAASGIDMATGAAVSLRASDINLSAAKGQFNMLEMQASADSFTGTLNRVRLVSDAVDVVANRLTERLKTCYRWVEEIEHVTAGQMISTIRNLFSVRARQSAITAKEDVKIDGERVHIG